MGAGYSCAFFAHIVLAKIYPHLQVPVSDGASSSLADYGQRVRLRNRPADAAPSKRVSMLLLHMDTTARQLRLNASGDTFTRGEDAETTLKISRNYFQPDALVPVIQQVAKFLQ